MGSPSFSNDFARTNISQDPVKSYTTKDSVLGIEYKEYTFGTNQDKEIENKVASFWKEVSNVKPPKTDFFKGPEIEECFEMSDEEYAEEEEIVVDKSNKYKWTNTYCLFKTRGLKNAATAGVPKKCSLCNNEKFPPEFADEKCLDMVRDYGENTEEY